MLQSSVIIVLKENKLVKVLGITEPVNHRELENSLMLIQNTDDFMEVKLEFYFKKKNKNIPRLEKQALQIMAAMYNSIWY